MRRLVLGVAAIVGAIGVFGLAPAAAQADRRVTIIDLDGAVDPLAARYVERGLRIAQEDNDAAVVIRIDTPGGLDSSMRSIVEDIAEARVPVVCWVGPSGARAASAGAIIAMGCPIVSMAPGTAIGAAHPVGFRGEVLDAKITNDAAAYARSLAETWGHDPVFAERMVRVSDSVSAQRALQLRVVDRIDGDLGALLAALDGMPTEKPQAPGSFATAGAQVRRVEMSFVEGLLHSAIDPNLAFLLFVLGLGGIIFEVLHPGITVPGILGALAFLASLIILGMLPVNLTGVVLLLLGLGAFIAEAYSPGFGAPAAVGFASLLLGGLFLFDASVPGAQTSRALVIAVALAIGAMFAFVVRAALKTRHQKITAPETSDLVGETGTVTKAIDPTGIVRARLHSWTARTASGAHVPQGATVRITDVDGLTLVVEPVGAEPVHEGKTEGGTS